MKLCHEIPLGQTDPQLPSSLTEAVMASRKKQVSSKPKRAFAMVQCG